MTSISTLSLTSPLRSSVTQAQAALTQAQTEVSSDAPADLGLTLGARTGTALSLRSEIDSLQSYSSSNGVATTRLATTSNVLDAFITSAQGIQSDLITASTVGGSNATLATSAKAALQSLTAGLNTTTAGQAIFGGINTGTSPLSDYFSTPTSTAKQAVDTAYQNFINANGGDPSKITGAQMQSFLSGTFSTLFSASNWQSTWSNASSQTISATIAPAQSVTTSVSANQGSFQQVAQAYTMLAEFTGSGTTLSAAAQAAVVSTATSLTSEGTASLTNVQSGVGVAQASITTANSQISAQVDVLTTNVSDLTSVDTYALSSQVTALQTQLEASYELTNRLQSLSLVNYLSSTG